MLTILYIYHSCFAMVNDRTIIVFDYWQDDAAQSLHKLLVHSDKQVYFIASHFHGDHYNQDILSWPLKKTPKYLLSYDIIKKKHVPAEKADFVMRPGLVYEDENFKLRAFRSTDIGVSMGITLPDGTVLFHAGDLNNWYFTEEEQDADKLKVTLRQMEGLYLSVVREISKTYPRINHLMFPIDPRIGKETLRGARQWLRAIHTDNFYPMHYWEQYNDMAESILQLRTEFTDTTFVI